MTDPITVGSLAAAAIAMAAEGAAKGFFGEAAKDAYIALKSRISRWASGHIDALEKSPTSKARQAVLAELIDAQPINEQGTIRQLAEALVQEIEKKRDAPVGVDIGRLRALGAELRNITSSAGVGVRIAEADIEGTFRVDQVQVGTNPGKR
jgi:hypothetical protein